MTEAEARAWFAARYAPDVLQRLDRYVALLSDEATRQSLIARSTMHEIWSRHLLDSAQLAMLGEDRGRWLDVGSGGGLPGLVLAILSPTPITLAEPRKLRAAFLAKAASTLELAHVAVVAAKAQALAGHFDVVTARAVASIADILGWTAHLVSRETRFLLPRGRSSWSELETAQLSWHGAFHVEQSLTHSESGIVVATRVAPR